MLRSLFLALAWFCLTGAAAPRVRGNYGFLTRYDCQEESAIRERVRVMDEEFGVKEFQIYDWFVDYSTPVAGDEWTDPFFHRRQTCKKTLEIYIDEIHRRGGRVWAYVQSVGSSRTDLEDPEHGIFKLRDTNGDWYWHARELPQSAFPTYFPNAAWANYMVATWAPAIKNLGFDGIHWDSLGRIAGDAGAETAGFHAFLRTAGALLRNYDLKQTFNFVDLAWWDRDLVVEALEFPYAECWSQASAIRYFEIMDDAELAQREGVFPMYPSVAVPAGSDETAVIGDRWNAALRHHLHYLVIGDGARRMKNQYWPETIALTPEEIAAIGGRR